MTPREHAALQAEVALAGLLTIGRLSGVLWPDDERALTAALDVARRLAASAKAGAS